MYLSDFTSIIRIFYDKKNAYDYTKFEGEGAAVRTSAEQTTTLKSWLTNTQSSLSKTVWMKWLGWLKALTERLAAKYNLLVTTSSTNTDYLARGIKEGATNSILIANQPVLYRNFEAIEMLKKLVALQSSYFIPLRWNWRFNNCWHRSCNQRRSNQDWFTFTYRPWLLNTTNCLYYINWWSCSIQRSSSFL